MYLPGASAAEKRQTNRRIKKDRANNHSPINMVPRAFCPLGSRVCLDITHGPFLSPKHTAHIVHRILCAPVVYIARATHNIYNMPPTHCWNKPFIAVRVARMLLPFSGPHRSPSRFLLAVSFPLRIRSPVNPEDTQRVAARGPHLRHELFPIPFINGNVLEKYGLIEKD